MLIVGIEQTTDRLRPETQVVRLASERTADRWLRNGRGGFAWPGAADSGLPPSQQNWHHRFRRAYVMPHGFRLSAAEVRAVVDAARGSVYARTTADAQAIVYVRHAERGLVCEPETVAG